MNSSNDVCRRLIVACAVAASIGVLVPGCSREADRTQKAQALAAHAKPNLPSTDVLFRVFQIRHKIATGTTFAVDVEKRQYLITAGHVVKGLRNGDTIDLLQRGDWKPIVISSVEFTSADVDIAVLSPLQVICSEEFALEFGMQELLLGQDAFVCGFPHDIKSDGQPFGSINEGFPVPIIRKGAVAGVNNMGFLLDMHINPGFSGSPVVYLTDKNDESRAFIAGVVVASHYERFDVQGETVVGSAELGIAKSIHHALNLIRLKPTGALLK